MKNSLIPTKSRAFHFALKTFPSLLGGHNAAGLFTTQGSAQIGHLSVANYGKSELKPSENYFTLSKCACLFEAFSAALFINILISSVTISLSIHMISESAGRPKSEARKCVAEFFVSIEGGGHKCTICRRIFKLSKNNFLSKQHTIISTKKEPKIPSSQNAH